MEAVVEQSRTTRQSLLVACDANMHPKDLKRVLWFKENCIFIEAPAAAIRACRSTSSTGELVETRMITRTYRAKLIICMWW